MKKIATLLLVFLVTASATAQFGGQRNNRFGRQQQPQSPPTENQIEAAEKKAEERRQEFVTNFLSTLEADDFQKEIAKQTIDDYFEKVKSFSKLPFENSVQRKDAFEALKKEHFQELRSLISENDNKKLDGFLSGDFDEGEVKKKKRKKRKKDKKN